MFLLSKRNVGESTNVCSGLEKETEFMNEGESRPCQKTTIFLPIVSRDGLGAEHLKKTNV